MRVSLIRHGMTGANTRQLYCGWTDLALSKQGRQDLVTLKETVRYPAADIYVASALKRASETLRILFDREPDIIIEEFKEMNFGDFEMKSYDQLRKKPEYQCWIGDINRVTCPGGESRDVFENRVMTGLNKLCGMEAKSAAVVCHGGVIASIMERLFPGQQDFYQWQPDYGRGYTLDIFPKNTMLISEI